MNTKEFLSKSQIEFDSFNVAGDADAQEHLRSHGFDSVPVVCVGDTCVKGVDLRAVARLVGVPYDERVRLPPAEIYRKWDVVLAAVGRYAGQVPFEKLSYASPDRDRDLRQLAIHALERPGMFIAAFNTGVRPRSAYREIAAPDMTGEDIAAFGDQNRTALRDWWERAGAVDPLDREIQVSWGTYSLHAMIEREAWHSAQHARQIMLFLERLGIDPVDPLTDDDLAGLPLPEHVWH